MRTVAQIAALAGVDTHVLADQVEQRATLAAWIDAEIAKAMGDYGWRREVFADGVRGEAHRLTADVVALYRRASVMVACGEPLVDVLRRIADAR